MKVFQLFVGIDVSKDRLDVAVRPSMAGPLRCKELVEHWRRWRPNW